MHHLTCGISSLLYSVNLILFTLLLVDLILCTSPHHSPHLHSHHLLLLYAKVRRLGVLSCVVAAADYCRFIFRIWWYVEVNVAVLP